MNGNDTFLDVNDAHLRVTSGNVYASAFNLDQIDIVMSSNTTSTVNFNNPTKAFNAASNIEVGTANLFVDTTTTRVGVGTASPATTLDVAGDLNVSGNLTIIGTTTTLDADHLRVKDPIIELGKDNPGTGDLGLVMTRPSGSSNVAMIFDELTDTLEIGYTQSNASDSTITMQSAATEPLSVNVNGTISGNGSGLTDLNATNITTGTLDRNTTGSAATLTTPRSIGGVNFDGSADIVPTTFGAATFDTDTLVVDSVNNRVGIGTDSPDCNLEIYGDTSSIKLTRSRNNTNFGCSVDFALLNSVNEKFTYGRLSGSIADNTDGSEDGFLSFQVGTNGNLQNNYQEEKMRILSNGNVGIGTSTPRTNLHIGQQLNSQGDKNTIPSAGLGISANFPSTTHAWFSNRVNATGDEYWGLAVGTIYDGASYLQNLNKNTVTYYNLLLQPNGGNVGIGKTDPGAKLDVNGSIRGAYNTNTTSYFGRSAVGYVGHNDWAGFAHLDRNSLDDYALLQNSAGRTILNSKSDQRISFSSGDQETMCVKGSNVGIGTSSPDSSLEVHGTGIHINGTVLRAMSAIGVVASGNYVKLCDFSALPTSTGGVCAILIQWGGGSEGGTYRYWQGHAAGIVSFNTYSDGNGTYNAAPSEPVTLNHHYHHRVVGPLTFIIDSDSANSSYGRQSLYVAPAAGIDNMSFSVIAMPLRR